MKSISYTRFFFLLLVGLFLIQTRSDAQFMEISWYSLIKGASDVLIIKVNRIEGEKYGEKAIAHVERSFKGTVQSDSIELPFVYAEWPAGNGAFTMVTESIALSFKAGDRYVALIRKWHRGSNPFAAQTQYEVINYPKATLFSINDNNNPTFLEMERLLNISNLGNDAAKVDSLISMTRSNNKEIRVDAIEALIDLKAQKAAPIFISLLRNDPDSQIRYSAAHGLGFLHSDSIVTSLLECLRQEKSKNVKFGIISTLGMQHATIAAPILLGYYEKEEYDIRNFILETVSRSADSTIVPTLIHLFLTDHNTQHRHQMAETIASFHTPEADEFSSKLLDTVQSFWIKSAVIRGWTESGYKKGYDQIVRWATIPYASGKGYSQISAEMQGLLFPLLQAVEDLGTPEQIVSTLKVFSGCKDSGIRQMALDILKDQLKKKITPELHKKIDEEIKTFPPD
jgi:hypothetical protein